MAEVRKPDEWLPLHIGDYQADTQHLTRDQHGAYLLLLMAYWRRGGPLPADDARLAAIAKATGAEWRKLKPIISEFFKQQGDLWVNKRSEEELVKAHGRVASRSEAGKRGAEARWQSHSNRIGDSPAEAMREHWQNDGPLPRTKNHLDNSQHLSMTSEPSLAELERLLRKAARWENEPAPKLSVTGPIQALIEAGANLETDVLPIVKALAPNVQTRTSWAYFVKPIREAHQARIGAGRPINGNGKSSQVDWRTFTHRDYENVIGIAKSRDEWFPAYGPPEKIPPDLMDDDLRRIIGRARH